MLHERITYETGLPCGYVGHVRRTGPPGRKATRAVTALHGPVGPVTRTEDLHDLLSGSRIHVT